MFNKEEKGSLVMNWMWRIVFTVLLLIGWGALGYSFADFTLGSKKRTEPITVEIPQGSTLQDIGKELKKKNLIRETYFFRIYATIKGKTNLLAGSYVIHPNENLDAMLDKFSTGKQNTVRVTVIEGWNVMQIANELEKKGFDKKEFLHALNHKKPKYDFEKEIPEHPAREYKLEGYLFPSTYDIVIGTPEEEIVNIMLEQFNKRLEKLKAREKLKTNPPLPNMTIDQWVTVASLIEREGQVRSELPTISGVIYNRLKNSHTYPLLQVDASVVYIYSMKGEKKTRVYEKDLQIDHPYNTYKKKGLPPGPISCPSEEALEAALNPEEHQYFFYVTREDGSRLHYFARNYEEQKRNIQISRRNRQIREAGGSAN